MSKPLFQLRKEVAELAEKSNIQDISSQDHFISLNNDSTTIENHNPNLLTENNKYSIKSNNVDLLSLVKDTSSTHGHIDTFSGKVLINTSKQLYIWNLADSNKPHCPFIKIPLNPHCKDELPICLLTWPATIENNPSTNTEFGLAVVYPNSGEIVFYQDLTTINNLYSQLSQNMAYTLDLKLASGEFITSAISVEPSGIVVATSHGKVTFITIRDSWGKPCLSIRQNLIKSQHNFFTNLFSKNSSTITTPPTTTSHHDIVSLKNGPIVGKGDRLLYITTRNGLFQIWQLSVTSNCYKRIDINIFDSILESLQDLYPFAYGSLQICDSHPFYKDDHLTQMILSSISNEQGKKSYILSTLIFDEKANNFSIFSTYRLNTYSSICQRPRLIIPTAMSNKNDQSSVANVNVLFSDAMVLTQISPNLDISFTLKRKWEDIISFRDGIDVFGMGYEHDNIYLLSHGINGILSIELKESMNNEEEEEEEETRFVKSHIDQAIYFEDESNLNPIEFNLSDDITLDLATIEEDLKLSANEIIHSTGKYVTSSMTNLKQHLTTRLHYFNNLIKFIEINFNQRLTFDLKMWIITNFEIMNSALNFLQFFDTHANSNLQQIWLNTLSQNNLSENDLIISKIDQYPMIWSHFLQSIVITNETLQFKSDLLDLINSCIYDAVLEKGEKQLRYNKLKLDPKKLNNDQLPWFITIDNLTKMNDIFFQYKFHFTDNNMKIESNDIKLQFLTLLKTLYYSFNQVRLWCNQTTNLGDATSQDIIAINKLYVENHIDWNHVLCEIGYQTQSIEITEFYKDLESLVQTLETLPNEDPEVTNLYQEFFNKFGMSFASTLFEYYAENNNLTELFYRFPDQHDKLVIFFQDNIDKYGNISWIQDIIDQRYVDASKTLNGLPLLNQDIDENQFHLNVAKLTALVEDQVNVKQLQQIQCNLDLLDGELEFINKLKLNQIELNKRYNGTMMETIFNKLKCLLNENKTISFNEIIELYSILSDGDSIYCALKLLTFNVDLIEFEIKKYLISTLWRRCLLLDLDNNEEYNNDIPLENTILYGVLERFFHERLFENNYPLPHITLLTDPSIANDALLFNLYGQHVDGSINDLKEVIDKEITTINDKLNVTKLQDIISSANISTGNQCVINYDTNEIEYIK